MLAAQAEMNGHASDSITYKLYNNHKKGLWMLISAPPTLLPQVEQFEGADSRVGSLKGPTNHEGSEEKYISKPPLLQTVCAPYILI